MLIFKIDFNNILALIDRRHAGHAARPRVRDYQGARGEFKHLPQRDSALAPLQGPSHSFCPQTSDTAPIHASAACRTPPSETDTTRDRKRLYRLNVSLAALTLNSD